jgi:hypothetical protein
LNKGSIDEGIDDFKRRTGCILLLNPRSDFKCGDVLVERPEKFERIGHLADLLKGPQASGKFDIDKLVMGNGEPNLTANFSDMSYVNVEGNIIMRTFRFGGKYKQNDIERLMYVFKDSKHRIVSLGALNGEMKKYSYNFDAWQFDFSSEKYYVIYETYLSKDFSICTVKGDEKGGEIIAEIMKEFKLNLGAGKNVGKFFCALSPPEKDELFVYGTKLGRLTEDYYVILAEGGKPEQDPVIETNIPERVGLIEDRIKNV